ncbi:MAG TPA: penicillin acylase family protein, partial [Limnochordales bacterium]
MQRWMGLLAGAGVLWLATAAAAGAPPGAGPTGAAAEAETRVAWPGLRAAVRIVEDRYGIPHVYAQDAWDLFFAVGYLHARDRLFQMDVSRRRAEGTLAELVGEAALAEDVQMRTLGLARAAEASLGRLSEGARADLEAYAAGVNAFIQQAEGAGALPPEYGALELTRVRPWRPVDSISVLKLVGFSLSFELDARYAAAAQAYVQALGPEAGMAAFRELWRSAPSDAASTVPDAVGYAVAGAPAGATPQDGAGGPAQGAGSPDEAALALAADWWQAVARLPAAAGARQAASDSLGSNWFVIGPSLAEGGYPILANDPHLPLTVPPVWYPQHLVAAAPGEAEPEIDVWGVAFPGVPWVILGHTRFVAWGATTNPVDQTDTFVERLVEQGSSLYTQYQGRLEPVQVLPQRFMVNRPGNGRPDDLAEAPAGRVPAAVLVVPRHGPIVRMDRQRGEALTVQWTGAYATHDGESFYRWNRARGLQDFLDGLRFMDAASQNWAYADVQGNIAYFAGAELPLRTDLDGGFIDGGAAWAPFLLRDGTGALRHDWVAWPADRPLPEDQGLPFQVLPASEMPHVVNPAQGFIVSANNDPVGTTLDGDPFNDRRANGGIYYLAPAYSIGFRAGRITELLRERARRAGRVSLADAMAVQADVVELAARRLMPFFLAAWQRARQADAPAALARLVTPETQEAFDYLSSWDFSTPTGVPGGWDAADDGQAGLPGEPSEQEIRASVAATLFNVAVGRLIHNTVDTAVARLGPDLPRPDGSMALRAILYHLEHFDRTGGRAAGLALFDAPGGDLGPADERDVILLASVEEAVRLLKGPMAGAFGQVRSLRDLRWGMLHRLVLQDLLGRPMPEAAGGTGGIPVDGGFEVVDASGFDPRADTPESFRFSTGPSVRFVVQMKPDGAETYLALPWGSLPPAPPEGSGGAPQAGGGLLPLWLANDYVRVPLR